MCPASTRICHLTRPELPRFREEPHSVPPYPRLRRRYLPPAPLGHSPAHSHPPPPARQRAPSPLANGQGDKGGPPARRRRSAGGVDAVVRVDRGRGVHRDG